MPFPRILRSILMLLAFCAAALGAGALGSIATASSVGAWYQTLNKPSFNPPGWVFGPVWTALYILMGVAAWRVWRRTGFAGAGRVALAIYFGQLILNTLWSILFFGLQSPGWALAEIVVLWAAILAMLVTFLRIDRWAGGLIVPYLLWVSFAFVLNAAIWRLN